MPRIRKKTSNRGTTRKRASIQQKVKESRKKSKKAAKKNTQWVSKHKKDPGIPNNFPYKDKILAEVAEQRRQAVEEKEKRKDERKAAKAAVKAGAEEKEIESDGEGSTQGIGSLVGTNLVRAKTLSKALVEQKIPSEVEDEAPSLINHDLPNLKFLLDLADVVIHVLDARDPLMHRSEHLERLVSTNAKQNLLLVLNKIDLCPREAVSGWLNELRKESPTIAFRSASAFLPSAGDTPLKGKGKAKESEDDAAGIEQIFAILGSWAEQRMEDKPMVVAVVGLTNSGKSSFVNSLLKKSTLPVYKLANSPVGPSTTTLPSEVSLTIGGKHVRVIDTPGLLWKAREGLSEADVQSVRAQDILLRNKGRIDRLKDPMPTINHIVSRCNTENLMLFYNLPAFSKGNVDALLSAFARSNGLVKKHGVLDLAGAARLLLRDWSTDKFPRYTLPDLAEEKNVQQTTPDERLAKIYGGDEKVLPFLRTKREMNKGGGVVKMTSGVKEKREISVEVPWGDEDEEWGSEDEFTGIDDEEESREEDLQGSDSEEESEEEEEESEEEEEESEEDGEEDGEDDESLPSPGKRKRAAVPSNPKKRVSFANGTKSAPVKPTARNAGPPARSTKKPSQLSAPKVANASSFKKTKVGQVDEGAKSSGGAYDFSKFF